MQNPTVTLDREAAQETLLALNERRQQLIAEQATSKHESVRAISRRQQDRVESAMRTLQAAIGEKWI